MLEKEVERNLEKQFRLQKKWEGAENYKRKPQ